MAQSTFEKTMRNVTLSDRPKQQSSRFSRKNWHFEIDLDPSDKLRLNKFMRLELDYYNTLVSGLSSRMRTMPESITESNVDNERLYLACAEHSFDPYNIFLMHPKKFSEGIGPELPPQMEEFRKIFFGIDSKGNRRFTDRIALLCQLFSTRAPIIPYVRRCMAQEIIEFFKTQSRTTKQAVPTHLQDEQVYKTAPQSLETYDSIMKRHVQLPKKALSVEWDEEQSASIFTIPYMSRKLVVPNMNFNADLKGWNCVIIHQAPGCIPISKTPWMMDIRHVQGLYQLKYTEVRNYRGGSALSQVNRK